LGQANTGLSTSALKKLADFLDSFHLGRSPCNECNESSCGDAARCNSIAVGEIRFGDCRKFIARVMK
jgi:hypothetical protein